MPSEVKEVKIMMLLPARIIMSQKMQSGRSVTFQDNYLRIRSQHKK